MLWLSYMNTNRQEYFKCSLLDIIEKVTCKCEMLRKMFGVFHFIPLFIAKKIDAFKQKCA